MKKQLLRIGAALLALLMCALSLASCQNGGLLGKGKTLLSLKKDGIKVTFSLNEYELMLTRVKGTLEQSNFDVNDQNFWAQSDKFNGQTLQTLNEFYKDSILDNCRIYVAALYFFERDGLTLSDASLAAVEDMMNELILTDGDGSKTKLNSLLSSYGVNYNILEDIYLMQEKVNAWKIHKYGENAELIGAKIKQEQLQKNYAHFQQIFLPTYTYVYETDANNDVIYYYNDGSAKQDHIYYDVHNGIPAKTDDGKPLLDKNGDQIYYVKNSEYNKIAYDAINGEPSHVMKENGTEYKTESLGEEALKELSKKADALTTQLEGSTYTEFENAMQAENEKNDAIALEEYLDGYYLKKSIDYAAMGEELSYLSTIVKELDAMEDGDVTVVKSTLGYHIIKKYPHTEKAYEKEENEAWFSNFYEELIDQLFQEECRKLFDEIKLNEKTWEQTPHMLDVATNYYY